MKKRKWILCITIILSIILILSGCGSKKDPNSSKASQKNIVSVKEKKQMENVDDEEKEESINNDIQEEEIEKEYKNKETKKPIQNEARSKDSTSLTKKNEVKEKQKVKKIENDANSKNSVVTVSIIGPEDVGTILRTTKVEIDKDDSVIDVLEKVTAEKNIHLECKGIGAAAYVRGIHKIYEFDKGVKSGWLYRVNGIIPGEGAGTYIVKEGDQIQWVYTLDLGREFGAAN